jgi:hypothetical protein
MRGTAASRAGLADRESGAPAMSAGSGLTLQGSVNVGGRVGLRETGLKNLVAFVAKMRTQDMRQPDAVAALHCVEDGFVLL